MLLYAELYVQDSPDEVYSSVLQTDVHPLRLKPVFPLLGVP